MEQINIHDLIYPAIRLNNDFIVVEKNRNASTPPVIFRRGSSLKNYISAADFRKVKQMKNGDNLIIKMTKMNGMDMYIYRFNSEYILKTIVLIPQLVQRLSSLLEMQQLYVNDCLALMDTDNIPIEVLRNKFKRFSIYQTMVQDYLSISQNVKDTSIKIENISKHLEVLTNVSNNALSLFKIQVDYVSPPPIYLQYSQSDFEFITIGLNSILCFLSSAKKIKIDLKETEKSVLLNFSTRIYPNEKLNTFLQSNSYDLILYSEKTVISTLLWNIFAVCANSITRNFLYIIR
ncbi:hypothetical protein LJB90_03840 [Eubacteriales bacterium OttesenSCG-928-G02]|nr:hypothetical protein [Eubacteriales bacterium OttesenSCG-928-G02]